MLMQRLGMAPDEYRDPKASTGDETGADVVAVVRSVQSAALAELARSYDLTAETTGHSSP
jgi:hypothetical protein